MTGRSMTSSNVSLKYLNKIIVFLHANVFIDNPNVGIKASAIERSRHIFAFSISLFC